MPRKRTWLVIFVALLLLGFATRGPIASTLFEWYLKGYCRTCLGSRLTYESLHYENNKWIFEHPVLTTKKRLEEGGYRFQANKAAVDVSISWIGHSLNLIVDADQPHLDIGKGAEDIKHILEHPNQTFHMFDVHSQFQVPKGTIFVHDFTQDDLVPIPLFFHIDLTCKKTRQGCVALWLGEQKKDDEGFIATFSSKEADHSEIHFKAENVDCCAMQQALRGIWPGYEAWEISKGYLEGEVTYIIPKDSPSYAEGALFAKNLVLKHKKIECEIGIPATALYLKPDAHFSLNGILAYQGKSRTWTVEGQGIFVQDGLSNWSVNMNLADPDIQEGLPANDTNFHFSASLKTRDGVFHKSLLKGTIAGLKGEIDIDGTSNGPLISCNFYGKANDFFAALPYCIHKDLDQRFMGNDLSITAHAEKAASGLTFKGRVNIGGTHTKEEALFGFALENSGFTLKDGWFTTEKLPLNKYLSPLLFKNNQMELEGIGDFVGYFDEHKLVVNYDAKDLILKNSDFAIEIKSLSEEGDSSINALTANFTFDFDKKTSLNTFPIRNATYFEKNTGLLFTEIQSKLVMRDAVAHFENLTTFCNGLYFAGNAKVDWSMPGEGVFEVDLRAQEMHGKISQLQHLLSHINKNLIFLKIPVEGNVALNREGGNLHFAFRKEGYDLESHIQGAMTDGTISEPNADLSLQELSMNFEYHHQGNQLTFSDIQGTLLVGKPHHVEEYVVTGDKVRFIDYARHEVEFDIWIGEKTRDILRLAGKTRSENDENGHPYINFLFNRNLSHFGDVHPSTFRLAFKNWSQLELFQLTFTFELEKLLADLQRFSRTGLFFLSRGMLKAFNDIEMAQGVFDVDVNYDSSRSTLNFRIDGTDIGLGGHGFKKFQLTGKKKGELWSVDQMQFDNISLAFDVLKESSLWNINFLGARLGDSLLIGMEGQYVDEEAQLDARINLLEADLGHLSDWGWLFPSLASQPVSGQLRVSGTVHAAFDKTLPHGMRLNIQMDGSFNHPQVKDVFFEDIKNLSLSYNASQGLKISNVRTSIQSPYINAKAGFFLQDATYNIGNKEWRIDGLHFDIPAENLGVLAQHLHNHFPDKITPSIAETVSSLKTTGSLQGSLHLSMLEPHSTMRLHLNDGLYHFMDAEHDLRGFVLDYDPYALKAFTEYRYKQQRFRIDAHSAVEGFDAGEMTLSCLAEDGRQTSSNPLKIYWSIHPQTGYYIQKMTGEFSGLTCDLTQDMSQPLTADTIKLVGRVGINMWQASGLLDNQIAASIANFELGTGYFLNGQWNILKAPAKPLSESILFQGELYGRDFEFFGYRFYQMSAQLSYSPEAAYIRNLSVSDNCGNMQIEQIDFYNHGNGVWQANIPSITANEFRPCLLTSLKTTPRRVPKSLVIRSVKLKDVNGILGEKNSFTGSGQLSFANPPKKNLQPTIFAIPAELLTRIGLDLAVLTPVRGTVLFDIREGKAVLNRFKDMYSKGRLSKFYLPHNGNLSYVDFDGNLNVQVRMKQYNLIFKLAELFTVTVQGTLTKPTYTLQKQLKAE